MNVTIPIIRSRGARFELVRQDVVESLATGGEVVAPQGVALWHYSFPLVTHTYDEAQEWMAALALLTKMGNTFSAPPPGFLPSEYVNKYWDGSWNTGTSLLGQPILASAGQTGSSVEVSNLVANETFLQRGDYFALINPLHSELKIVTADAESDASGNATVEFTPPIRTSPDSIDVLEPRSVFRLKNPSFVYNMSPNRLVNMTIDAVESYGFDT